MSFRNAVLFGNLDFCFTNFALANVYAFHGFLDFYHCEIQQVDSSSRSYAPSRT